ncbi:hypothetical protein CCM_04874 [Cordyceps militaris CM01]|uniref:Uncharacterized protein n=1 Tax=Cordyceps militaris (strain CM01) TaxID=983644 RepID=G3JF60_CORMM|nr:uncharacterized protein CCM_04874 [Cordyceps militaris CM01]EGX93500.1 hypothetical protein CCM_04874 [Cordyceps militaris CM01]
MDITAYFCKLLTVRHCHMNGRSRFLLNSSVVRLNICVSELSVGATPLPHAP